MAKNNACLKEENLLTLLSLNNLIVPEIQREYVWGNNPDVLVSFCRNLRKRLPLVKNVIMFTPMKL